MGQVRRFYGLWWSRLSACASNSADRCDSSRGQSRYPLESGLRIYLISSRYSIAKYCRKFFAPSEARNKVKGFNSYWACVVFPPISCLEKDSYPVSVANSSFRRLTYAFCSYSRNGCRITGCEHLMQMECYGVSLTFSETQHDELMSCFSHLVLMFRGKKTNGFCWHFLNIRKLSNLQGRWT